MKYGLFLLLLLFTMQLVSAQQANAGPDKVICSGTGVEIGAMNNDPNLCYYWSAVPTDSSITNLKTPKITVNPTITTIYTLTVVGQDFSSRSTDDVKVAIVDLKEIVSKEDSEPDDYLIKPEDGGSFFINGKFKFKANTGPNHDATVNLSWDMYDLDFLNENIAQGTTVSGFSYTFSNDLEEGRLRIRFWVDKNNNSEPDNDECKIETEFEVKKIFEQTVSVSRAVTTASITNVDVDAILHSGTMKIKIKDSKEDFRCAAELKRDGSVLTWPVSATTPDEILSKNDFDNINSNINTRLKIVKRITWCGGPATPGFVIVGCTTLGRRNTITVAEGTGADVWTHEIGHSEGLSHRPSTSTGLPKDKNNLMYPEALGTQNILNKSECEVLEHQ